MYLTMLHSSMVQFWQPELRWQRLQHPMPDRLQPEIWICHLETDSDAVSGNKILKLRYTLELALQQKKSGVFTFGGAFSNHLAAVAEACQRLELTSTAYVRTDKLDDNNPTLAYCAKRGMTLIPLDRSSYRQRNNADFLAQLQQGHPQLMAVPEGGSSVEGAAGIGTINFANAPSGTADLVCCATASGGTLAGLIANPLMPTDTQVLGLSVVNDSSLPQRIMQLLPAHCSTRQWQLNADFIGAGYARFDTQLLDFCREMAQQHLFVEPVYTGKALYALMQLIAQQKLSARRISFFHTGGLQGLQGLHYRKLITAADLALLSGLTAD